MNNSKSINSCLRDSKLDESEVEESPNTIPNPHLRKTNLEVEKYEVMQEVEISSSLPEDSEKNKDKNWITTIKMKLDYYIGHVKEAPHYSRDNEFILHGYRINFNSCKHISRSLCMCHNETVNIWTHLIGALVTILFIIITGLSVGPYGKELNKLQIAHQERNIETFNNYSTPFFTAKPVFHNGRIVLNALQDFISNSNRNRIDSGIIIQMFNNQIEKLSLDIEAINRSVEKVEIIDCISCIEDFVRNIITIGNLLENLGESDNREFLINQSSLEVKLITLKARVSELNKTTHSKMKDDENFEVGYYNLDKLESNSELVKWPIYVQLVCAIFCLCCSSTFHLFVAYGAKVGDILNRLDYAGISILIAGSCYPPYYYMFYCNSGKLKYNFLPFLVYLYVYLIFISVFALAVFLGSLSPSFNKAENRRLRGVLFLILGISAGVPIVHLMFFL